MSIGKQALSMRKKLDEAAILALCDGRTCRAIALAMRESRAVVRRHLQDLARRRRVAAERMSGYMRYSRVQS